MKPAYSYFKCCSYTKEKNPNSTEKNSSGLVLFVYVLEGDNRKREGTQQQNSLSRIFIALKIQIQPGNWKILWAPFLNLLILTTLSIILKVKKKNTPKNPNIKKVF